jgi:hypothetical protein
VKEKEDIKWTEDGGGTKKAFTHGFTYKLAVGFKLGKVAPQTPARPRPAR